MADPPGKAQVRQRVKRTEKRWPPACGAPLHRPRTRAPLPCSLSFLISLIPRTHTTGRRAAAAGGNHPTTPR